MKRIEVERKDFSKDLSKKEKEIMRLFQMDESGFIVYDGDGSVASRTGSPIIQLIEWYLYKKGEKPLDADIFSSILKTKLGSK